MDLEGDLPIQYPQEAGAKESSYEDSDSSGPWVEQEGPHPRPPQEPRAGRPDPDYIPEEQVYLLEILLYFYRVCMASEFYFL